MTSPTPFAWYPNAEELIYELPTTSTGSDLVSEQRERFEPVGPSASVQNRYDLVDAIADNPAYADGTAMFFEDALHAIIVRDALRHLGYEADRLWDEGGASYKIEQAQEQGRQPYLDCHVVVTSKPFVVPGDPREG